ncbi:MAG: MerR family transcriptional regulator [Caldilineaceae bacterium]|nr:MerR family transcriptional regulator [Caldilineaceae bacterium]
MNDLSIGKLADAAHVAITTIRYYERRGLMPEPERRASGYRIYPADSVTRLRFIKNAQMLGFSLEEIAQLLSLRVGADINCAEVQQQAANKISEIEDKVQLLLQMQDALARLVEMCNSGLTTDGCPFIDVLEAEIHQSTLHAKDK